ncbi:MAG TPA: hypothetical protein VMJ34_13675 [Bryobacteraceae bacterium]|nr:hypothetical protein [Bryobacteraceae bacterium]
MRAACLFVALSSALCAMAQDPAKTAEQAPAATENEQSPRAPASEKFRALTASRPDKVCAVRLLEMPIPKDEKFTIRTTRPPKIDPGILAEPPAPACPKEKTEPQPLQK